MPRLSAPYKKGDTKQLEQIINSVSNPIDIPYENTSNIQKVEFDYQCTNVV